MATKTDEAKTLLDEIARLKTINKDLEKKHQKQMDELTAKVRDLTAQNKKLAKEVRHLPEGTIYPLLPLPCPSKTKIRSTETIGEIVISKDKKMIIRGVETVNYGKLIELTLYNKGECTDVKYMVAAK